MVSLTPYIWIRLCVNFDCQREWSWKSLCLHVLWIILDFTCCKYLWEEFPFLIRPRMHLCFLSFSPVPVYVHPSIWIRTTFVPDWSQLLNFPNWRSSPISDPHMGWLFQGRFLKGRTDSSNWDVNNPGDLQNFWNQEWNKSKGGKRLEVFCDWTAWRKSPETVGKSCCSSRLHHFKKWYRDFM